MRRFHEIRAHNFHSDIIETRCLTKDGGTRWVKVRTRAPQGELQGVSGTLADITEQKRSEAALLQTQKLESLGVLAGGIAHDFNNLLVAIMGNADLAMQRLHDQDPSRAQHHMRQVSSAIGRAAELCRQLLAYSGKGRFIIETVDLNELVREMAHLLKVSIGKGVSLDYHLAEGLPAIEADPSQIRQAVMNLVINASEAIGDRDGRILIETELGRMESDPKFQSYLSHDLEASVSVHLSVKDNGCGMDDETLKRIFDPFFTTKFTGRGLGLAAILGIVRSHKGSLLVDSRIDEGTTFCIQFPASSRPIAHHAPAKTLEGPLRGHGLVLLVDDEPTVREIVAEALEVMGFKVAEASNGQAGMEAFEARQDEFVAVILDLTMPVMGGEEAFRRIQQLRPGIPTILMSGYSEQEAMNILNRPGLAGFLQKPFKLLDLSRQLQRVLASSEALD
jgi:signal transduction histidine kinase/ActR/RegA family two-component response regulator